MPDEDKIYTVMWDYNIGLVRTTSLFKCNHYNKVSFNILSIEEPRQLVLTGSRPRQRRCWMQIRDFATFAIASPVVRLLHKVNSQTLATLKSD